MRRKPCIAEIIAGGLEEIKRPALTFKRTYAKRGIKRRLPWGKVARLYLEGRSIKSLANQFKCHRHGIQYILDQSEIKRRITKNHPY